MFFVTQLSYIFFTKVDFYCYYHLLRYCKDGKQYFYFFIKR